MPLTLLAVFVGGAVGTGLRLGADALIPGGAFPVAALVVNVVGSFLLALLVGRAWATAPEWVKAGLGAGVLGAFTTFSAIAVSVVQLSTSGEPAVAGAYLVASVVLGIGAAAAGLRLGSGGSSTRLDEVNE